MSENSRKEKYFDGESWLDVYIDKPALKCYYLNDKLHRRDGPAYISGKILKEWWLNGKLHR